MLDNCTITNTTYAALKDAKKAKMAGVKIANMKIHRDKLMDSVFKKEEVKPVVEQTFEPVTKEVVSQVEAPVVEKEEEKSINFPENHVYEARLNQLGVTTYKNLAVKGNINISGSRRLRVNNLVVLTLTRVRDYVSGVMELPVLEKKVVEEEKRPTFDFSQLSNMNTIKQETQSVKPTLSVDDYFKKETKVEDNHEEVEDANMVEINSLTKENANLRYIVESKKEELANILKIVENNERLCEDRKRELKEENLALTQELTDLLAMIDQNNDIINQQEAFLANKEENGYSR